MIGRFDVALVARIVPVAASEPDRYDIQGGMVVPAAGFRINFDSVNFLAAD